jgi:hypothetical protein
MLIEIRLPTPHSLWFVYLLPTAVVSVLLIASLLSALLCTLNILCSALNCFVFDCVIQVSSAE